MALGNCGGSNGGEIGNRHREVRTGHSTADGIFCADYRILSAILATQLQRSFDVLTELFDLVGLQTNVEKRVSMVFQPCCAIWGHSMEAYIIRIKGEGFTYQERLLQWVHSPECNVYLVAESLVTHLQVQYGVGQGDQIAPPLSPLLSDETRTYHILFFQA